MKFFNPHKSSVDTESVLQLSNTLQLLIGLSLILYYGNRTNELQGLGFEHMLRVQQAELVSKSAHFLVEHERWHKVNQEQSESQSRLSAEQQQYIHVIETHPTAGTAGTDERGAQWERATEVRSMAPWLVQNSHTSPQLRGVRVFDKSCEFYLLESLIETVKNEHAGGTDSLSLSLSVPFCLFVSLCVFVSLFCLSV